MTAETPEAAVRRIASEAKAELIAAGVPAQRIAIEPDDCLVVLTAAGPDGPLTISPSYTGWCYGPDDRHVDSTAALLDQTDIDRWTAAELAADWGYSLAHTQRILRSVPRGRVRRSVSTGAKLYCRADADAARIGRPGRGARTDLYAEARKEGGTP